MTAKTRSKLTAGQVGGLVGVGNTWAAGLSARAGLLILRALSLATTSPNPQLARRNRAVRLTVLGSAGAKIFAMACTFAQVPIALHYLGGEGYGLWIVLMSAFGILNFVDFGLGIGMQEQMTEAFARDDLEGVRRAFISGTRALLMIGGACALLSLPLAWWGPWGDWFGVMDPELRRQAPLALVLVIGAFVVGLPGNAVAHLAAAVQQSWWHSVWNAGMNALTLAAIWLAAEQRWGILPFVAVSALLPTLQNAGMWCQLRRQLGWAGKKAEGLNDEDWRRMWRTSATFAFPQIMLAVLGWLPAFAISLGVGAGAVTMFNLLQRIFSPVAHGHAVVLAPLWPMYAEARLRGDNAWLHRAQSRAFAASALAMAGLACLALFSATVLHWWLGAAVSAPPAALAWSAALWFGLQVFQRHYHYALLGRGRIQALALHSGAGFVGAIGGLIMGSLAGSATWALLLGSTGYALCGLPGLIWNASRPTEHSAKENAA